MHQGSQNNNQKEIDEDKFLCSPRKKELVNQIKIINIEYNNKTYDCKGRIPEKDPIKFIISPIEKEQRKT